MLSCGTGRVVVIHLADVRVYIDNVNIEYGVDESGVASGMLGSMMYYVKL